MYPDYIMLSSYTAFIKIELKFVQNKYVHNKRNNPY